MSGQGKGGKDMGKGGAQRRRKVLRENIQGITKPAIRRLARRGGVKRISGLVYEETRGVLKVFLEHVIRDAVTYTEHARRKTVTAMDVVYALKRQGRTLYGFDSALPAGRSMSKERAAPKKKKKHVRPEHVKVAPKKNEEEEEEEGEEKGAEDENDNGGGGGGGAFGGDDDVEMAGPDAQEDEQEEQKGEEDEGEEGEEDEDPPSEAELVRARKQVHDMFEKEKSLWSAVNTAPQLLDSLSKLDKVSSELETVMVESLKAKDPSRHYRAVLCKPIPEHDRLRKSLVDIFRASDPDLDVCGVDDEGADSGSSGGNRDDAERVLTAAFKKQCVFGELSGGADKYLKYVAEEILPAVNFYAIVATDRRVAEQRNNNGGFAGFPPHKSNRILAFTSVKHVTDWNGSVFDLHQQVRVGRHSDAVEYSLYPKDSHLVNVRTFCGTKAHGQAWNLLRYAFLRERHMALVEQLAHVAPKLGPTMVTIGLARGANGGLLKPEGDRSKTLHSKLSKLYAKRLGVGLLAPMWKTTGAEEGNSVRMNGQALSSLDRASDNIRYVFVPKIKEAPEPAASKKKKKKGAAASTAAAAAGPAAAAGSGAYVFVDARDLAGDVPAKLKAIRTQVERVGGQEAARGATADDFAKLDRLAPFGPELNMFAPLEQVLAASKDRV
jgi:histone H4